MNCRRVFTSAGTHMTFIDGNTMNDAMVIQYWKINSVCSICMFMFRYHRCTCTSYTCSNSLEMEVELASLKLHNPCSHCKG